jgi:hypothetical protein
VANRWQEFQIETKLSHELFISNQTLNAPAPLNVRTGVSDDLQRRKELESCLEHATIFHWFYGTLIPGVFTRTR